MQNDRDLLAAQSDVVENTTIVGILDKPSATSLLLRSLYHNSDASTHPYSAIPSLTTTVPLIPRNFSYDGQAVSALST